MLLGNFWRTDAQRINYDLYQMKAKRREDRDNGKAYSAIIQCAAELQSVMIGEDKQNNWTGILATY
jgi:hypothetical protein